MEKNEIIIEIGKAKIASSQPWKVRVTVDIRNSVDDIKNYNENNSEEVQGYLESHELIGKLDHIMRHMGEYIKAQHTGINVAFKEE